MEIKNNEIDWDEIIDWDDKDFDFAAFGVLPGKVRVGDPIHDYRAAAKYKAENNIKRGLTDEELKPFIIRYITEEDMKRHYGEDYNGQTEF